MTEARSMGISRTTFIVGIVVAILASSLITLGTVTLTDLVKGRARLTHILCKTCFEAKLKIQIYA